MRNLLPLLLVAGCGLFVTAPDAGPTVDAALLDAAVDVRIADVLAPHHRPSV